MKKKKIMILGASILQLPAILKAKEMGLEVIAVDMDINAIGFKHADVCLNISTINILKVIEAAKEYEIDAVMTLASDMPMRTVAAVAKELNIVGISRETAINVTNKTSMRAALKKHNVPIPMFFKVVTWTDYLYALRNMTDKIIVKPADNSGSRGVILVEDLRDEQFIKYAFEYSKNESRNGEIIVEEYMNGPEVSIETLSFDGKTHIVAITDKLTTGSPNFVEMGHSIPSQLSSHTKSQIEKVVYGAVKALGINNGPSHTEIIITQDGPKVVEVGARLGGDNITTHLVPLATGINMVEACIQIALGQSPKIDKVHSKGAAIRYFNTTKGTLKKIIGEQEAKKTPGVTEVYFTKKVGSKLNDIHDSTDRIGFVITQGKDTQEAIQICENVIKQIKIVTEK